MRHFELYVISLLVVFSTTAVWISSLGVSQTHSVSPNTTKSIVTLVVVHSDICTSRSKAVLSWTQLSYPKPPLIVVVPFGCEDHPLRVDGVRVIETHFVYPNTKRIYLPFVLRVIETAVDTPVVALVPPGTLFGNELRVGLTRIHSDVAKKIPWACLIRPRVLRPGFDPAYIFRAKQDIRAEQIYSRHLRRPEDPMDVGGTILAWSKPKDSIGRLPFPPLYLPSNQSHGEAWKRWLLIEAGSSGHRKIVFDASRVVSTFQLHDNPPLSDPSDSHQVRVLAQLAFSRASGVTITQLGENGNRHYSLTQVAQPPPPSVVRTHTPRMSRQFVVVVECTTLSEADNVLTYACNEDALLVLTSDIYVYDYLDMLGLSVYMKRSEDIRDDIGMLLGQGVSVLHVLNLDTHLSQFAPHYLLREVYGDVLIVSTREPNYDAIFIRGTPWSALHIPSEELCNPFENENKVCVMHRKEIVVLPVFELNQLLTKNSVVWKPGINLCEV